MPIAGRAILAVETASPLVGIALADENGPLCERYLDDGDARGERLADLAAQALADCDLKSSDLGGVGVCVGPGSYTGLRVGLSFARGIALVDDLPTIGIGSLELVALAGRQAAPEAETIFALLSAGRDRFYAAVYAVAPGRPGLREVAAAEVVSASELAAVLARHPHAVLCHDAGGRPPADGARSIEVSERRAGLLAVTAAARLSDHEGTTAEAVLPAYVGATNARKNRNRVVLGVDRCD